MRPLLGFGKRTLATAEAARTVARWTMEPVLRCQSPVRKFKSDVGSQRAGDSDRDRLVVKSHGAVSFVAGGWKG